MTANASTDGSAIPASVKSAARTIDILELLAGSERRLTLSEIQRRLDFPKSSLHGLLRTLVARGWVETDDRGTAYSVGLSALRAGATFLDRDPVVQVASAVLARLRRQLDETVHLARLDGADMVYLASRESPHHLRVTSRIGRRLPAHATSLGKAVLSTLDPVDVGAILPAKLAALTPDTVVEHDELRTELSAARVRGWAVEHGQNTPGLTCYAVAIPSMPTVDAISCSIPQTRLNAEHEGQIVTELMAAADEIAQLCRARTPR
ncbi:IclR family transcriptional regulator [Actinokineospora sp. HUAS TT18]|uniref:IclR family transcriptional regulator n=1 Tax=Actinokineospora sp. HUAS TT18 TaxID=3447451 RepID=UPI003F5208A5